jgi:hypothetical protein
MPTTNTNISGGWHFPGDEYLGPGTPVVDKIINNVRPKSHNDYVALQHDIDYLSTDEPLKSDLNAVLRGNNSPDGLALKLGLGGRMIGDLLLGPFHSISHFNNKNTTDPNTKLLQEQLQLISGSQAWNPFYWT